MIKYKAKKKGGENLFSNAKDAFIKHLKNNTSIYFFLLLSFIVGVSVGALTVNGLTTMQRDELKNYFIGFLQLLDTQNIDNAQLFKLTAVENIKQIFIIWILGVCIVGIPFIYLFVGMRGFLTGFTSGFIIHSLGMKGILYITGSMFLKEIIIIPCIIILGANGVKFSLGIIKSKSQKRMSKENLKSNLVSYCLATGIISVVIMAGTFVEAYLLPVITKIMAPIFTN